MLDKISKYKLEFIVFWSGACVMVLEVAGSRVVAPFVGTSIFVWTSLIGVVLASLSMGYWYGGKLADKTPTYKMLSRILLFSALFVLLTHLFGHFILENTVSIFTDFKTAAVFYGLILFSPASFCMGMVSPYAAKLKIKSLQNSGSTIGSLYALSTVGSIFGTFSTGFYLFYIFRTSQILLLVALVLIILGIISAEKKITIPNVFLLVLLSGLFFFDREFNKYSISKGLVDLDTPFSRVLIYDTVDETNNRPMRVLYLDKSTSSAIYLDGEGLPFRYVASFEDAITLTKDFRTTLVVGGGSHTFPKRLIDTHKELAVDVVEIDPGLTELAYKYFDLKEDPRLNIIHDDGRTFLNSNKKQYDIIFLDAFNSFYSIPFHLTTKEFSQDLYNGISPDGILVANIISSIEGESGDFLKAYYSTLSQSFPYIYVYPTVTEDKTEVQNLIIVAYKNPDSGKKYENAVIAGYAPLTIVPDLRTVLYDDFAPVEKFTDKIISASMPR